MAERYAGEIRAAIEDEGDLDLANDFHTLMEKIGADFTKAFRSLASVVLGKGDGFRSTFGDDGDEWLARYEVRLHKEDMSDKVRADAMNLRNPLYIPRNHLVEEALAAANTGDLGSFDQLMEIVSAPFTARDGMER